VFFRNKPGPASADASVEPLERVTEAALAGDPAALRGLLTALSPDMARVARCVLGSSAPELDDVVQESLLGLLRALPTFRGDCSLRRFANRIAVRTAIATRRRARKRAADNQRFSIEPAPIAMFEDRDPEDDFLAARREALLMQLLDELPEIQAETLALRVVLGLSLEETAAATSAPENTVRSRLRLAREALRARIEREPSLLDLLGGER
jgi:RNA polymerase sigma factor (sigma-70 family)